MLALIYLFVGQKLGDAKKQIVRKQKNMNYLLSESSYGTNIAIYINNNNNNNK